MVGSELTRAQTTASAIESADNSSLEPAEAEAEAGAMRVGEDGGTPSGVNPADKLLLVDCVGGGILQLRARQ